MNNGGGRRHFGDGLAQWQPYCETCAALKGIQVPHPEDHQNMNSCPRTKCLQGGHIIRQVVGCGVHKGQRDAFQRCWWCELEKTTYTWHNSIPQQQKTGYNDP